MRQARPPPHGDLNLFHLYLPLLRRHHRHRHLQEQRRSPDRDI